MIPYLLNFSLIEFFNEYLVFESRQSASRMSFVRFSESVSSSLRKFMILIVWSFLIDHRFRITLVCYFRFCARGKVRHAIPLRKLANGMGEVPGFIGFERPIEAPVSPLRRNTGSNLIRKRIQKFENVF